MGCPFGRSYRNPAKPHVFTDSCSEPYFLRIYDLERGISTRITDGGSEEASSWSRDGKRIAYVTSTGNTSYLYDVPADGSSAPQFLVKGVRMRHVDRSPDDHISFFNLVRRPTLAIYAPVDHQVTEFSLASARNEIFLFRLEIRSSKKMPSRILMEKRGAPPGLVGLPK
jgi:WD40 repeat protein